MQIEINKRIMSEYTIIVEFDPSTGLYCGQCKQFPEAMERVKKMVCKMDELGFGSCTNTYACEAECPKQIKRQNIARLNRQWIGQLFGRDRRD